MNFPQLPTDNLYKFMALAGFVVVLAAVFLPAYLIFDIGRLQIIATAEIEVQKDRSVLLESETKDLDRERDELSREIEHVRKKPNLSPGKRTLSTHGALS